MWIKRFEKPMQTIKLYKSLIKHIWFISCLVTDAEPKKARKEKILYIILIMN